jgi:Asp-tRNA(Asn)/Glu-tRNA(Gln) amidotransferase A subunit family amidase
MRIRCLLVAAGLALMQPLGAGAATFDLQAATVKDIQAAMDAGALTSEKLVQLYLNRIAAYDHKGPAINTVITLNGKALEEARALDAERKSKGPRSPLHGVAVVVKDLYDAVGMPTSGGFVGLKDSYPWRDGWVVEQLKASGAIILAKVNTLDWFAETAWGASTLGGQTRNPYNPEYVPGASSSGTGAAMAAWFATIGFGSETGVSIRNPTSENNLVGLAPTHGLISRYGMIMSAFTHERGGPMTRSVVDLAAALTPVAGFDNDDLTTMASRGHVPAGGYLQFVDPQNGLKGARIGVLREMFRAGPKHAEGLALIEQAIKDLRAAGATVYDPVATGLPLLDILSDTRVASFEKREATNLYFQGLGPNAKYKTLGEMIEKNPKHLAHLKQQDAVGDLDGIPEYVARLKNRETLHAEIVGLMDRYQLDALVYPFKTLPATRIVDGWDNREADNPLSSQTGLPGLLVPAGFVSQGLPIALEFLGRPFAEPRLITLASAYEAKSHHRRSPPTTPPLAGERFDY